MSAMLKFLFTQVDLELIITGPDLPYTPEKGCPSAKNTIVKDHQIADFGFSYGENSDKIHRIKIEKRTGFSLT